jgi:hypothetical protein
MSGFGEFTSFLIEDESNTDEITNFDKKISEKVLKEQKGFILINLKNLMK